MNHHRELSLVVSKEKIAVCVIGASAAATSGAIFLVGFGMYKRLRSR